jgi:hypothetical protein
MVLNTEQTVSSVSVSLKCEFSFRMSECHVLYLRDVRCILKTDINLI